MRSIKELLKVVLEELKEHPDFDLNDWHSQMIGGLCWFVIDLSHINIITYPEQVKLLTYIENNRPKPGQKYYCKAQKRNSFYWPRLELTRRIGWLELHSQKKGNEDR